MTAGTATSSLDMGVYYNEITLETAEFLHSTGYSVVTDGDTREIIVIKE